MSVRLWKKSTLSQKLSVSYVLGFALVHILFFRDGFYDINRCKYAIFIWSVYPAALAVGITWLVERLRGAEPLRLRIRSLPLGFALAFALCVFLSCCTAQDPIAALTGSLGRKAGGLFWIGCILLFLLARQACAGGFAKPLLIALCASGCLCAGVGITNFFRVDPLLFYDEGLQGVYRDDFISTIGNINFFSAYMCLLIGIGVSGYTREKGKALRIFWLLCSMLGMAGLLCARSESGFAGLACAGIGLCLFGLARSRELARAFAALASMFLAAFLLAIGTRLSAGETMPLAGSLAGLMLAYPAYLCAAAILSDLCAKMCVRVPNKRGTRKRFRRGMQVLLLCALAGIAFLVCTMVYCTRIRPDIPLSGVLSYLRMDDRWGTFRGFIWKKTIVLYGQCTPAQKLLGIGPDCYKPLLVEKCYDEMRRLTGILFDNAHNEPLQLLITTGVLGLGSYLGLVLCALMKAWKSRRHGILPLAAAVAIAAHFGQSLFNIAQPETTPAVFLLLAVCACAQENQTPYSPGVY